MEQLNCYMCHKMIPRGLNGLGQHFTAVHGLTICRGMSGTGFECGQDGCRRRFQNFFSLRKHIRLRHLDDRGINPKANTPNVPDHLNDQVNDQDMGMVDHDRIIEDENEIRHENEIRDENVNTDDDVDFDSRTSIVRMIARFQCNVSMTGSMLTQVIDECEELLFTTRRFLKNKVTQVFRDQQMLDDDHVVQDALQTFEFDNPFHGLRSLDQQIEALKKNCGYIEPIEIPLGYRLDNGLDGETGTYVPKMIMETFQYVPIIETLKLVLSSPDVRQAIMSEKKLTDGLLGSFIDGQYFNIHPFFSRYNHAIRIQLYYDELEIVNPLGSKTGVHKIGAFYYTLQNLPPHMNSELSNIHVLVLCCDSDVKKYGFQKILSPFLRDLAKLESDDGVLVRAGDEELVLRGSIAAFCGDGLTVHDVFNLLGPSANKFCRMCLYSRDNLLAGSLEPARERSEEVFREHLALLEGTNFSPISKTATGVRGECCLHSSRYFHISRNKIFDPMHDFLCGICHVVVKAVTHKFILVQRKFTVEYFNGRISSFQYGFVERKNKPSANFTEGMLRKREHTLSQKAMQMWCLVRVYPFLVYGKIPDGDPHMGLIIILQRIMELVFAPKITESLLPYLTALIADFFHTFITLFPDINPINKFHHLTHYPECISWSGPLVHYYCMRYEAKHNDIKVRAQNVHNFINSPKTLIRVSQCGQSSKWGSRDVKLSRVHAWNGQTTCVENTHSREFLLDIDYVDSDKVFCSKSVYVNGVEFRPGLFVCLEAKHDLSHDLPLFGCIEEIVLLKESEVYLLTSLCRSSLLDTNLNAYLIERGDAENTQRFIQISNLAYFKPVCCWTVPSSADLYISLRHIIL